MHLNHYENPYSRLAQYDELRMRQHGSLPKLYADDLRQYTSLNSSLARSILPEEINPFASGAGTAVTPSESGIIGSFIAKQKM